MTIPGPYILADAVAFVSTLALTAVLRRLAVRHQLLDHPGRGKAHSSPTPYLGGVAIVTGTLLAAGLAAPLRDPRMLTLAVAAVAVAVLGLADDLWSLSVSVRLTVEGLAAGAVVVSGTGAGVVPGIGYWPDMIISTGWIILMTNSFNLLDNSDGAAAGIAAVTAAALAALALRTGWESVGILQLALSAGCAGFLVHNWAPARIFMGDSGSLFLGFVICASAVLVFGSPAAGGGVPWAGRVSGLLLMTFVAAVDTGTVVLSRRRAGRPVVCGGTDHAAHRLRALGLGTSQATALLCTGAGLSCTAGLLVALGMLPAAGALAVTLTVGAGLILLAQRVHVLPVPRAG